jgi:hypothetical protein
VYIKSLRSRDFFLSRFNGDHWCGSVLLLIVDTMASVEKLGLDDSRRSAGSPKFKEQGVWIRWQLLLVATIIKALL